MPIKHEIRSEQCDSSRQHISIEKCNSYIIKKYIEILNLGDNLISDYGMNAIKNIISNCSIVNLSIGSNMISELGLEAIVDDLIKNTVLKHLDVI